MTKIRLIWADGTEEEVTCDDWYRNMDGMVVICLNPTTREYRYIFESKLNEIRSKR